MILTGETEVLGEKPVTVPLCSPHISNGLARNRTRTSINPNFVSVIQTSQLMLYSEIIAFCSEIHTKHIDTLCGQNVEFVNVKHGGTYSDHWASKD
jgi:hypothetical protein